MVEVQRANNSRQREESSLHETPLANTTALGAHVGTTEENSEQCERGGVHANALAVPATPEHTPRAPQGKGMGRKVKHMVSIVNARGEASGNKSPSVRSNSSCKDNESDPGKTGRASGVNPLPFKPAQAGKVQQGEAAKKREDKKQGRLTSS